MLHVQGNGHESEFRHIGPLTKQRQRLRGRAPRLKHQGRREEQLAQRTLHLRARLFQRLHEGEPRPKAHAQRAQRIGNLVSQGGLAPFCIALHRSAERHQSAPRHRRPEYRRCGHHPAGDKQGKASAQNQREQGVGRRGIAPLLQGHPRPQDIAPHRLAAQERLGDRPQARHPVAQTPSKPGVGDSPTAFGRKGPGAAKTLMPNRRKPCDQIPRRPRRGYADCRKSNDRIHAFTSRLSARPMGASRSTHCG